MWAEGWAEGWVEWDEENGESSPFAVYMLVSSRPERLDASLSVP